MQSIRPFRQEDEAAVRQMVKDVYDEHGFSWDPEGYHADLYDMTTHYLNDHTRLFVAETDDGIVGCCGIALFPALPGETGTVAEHNGKVRVCGADCEILRLYVHPSARRLGLGRELTWACLEAGRENGKTCLEIWSDKLLTKSHALYQSLGAQIIGERICDDPDEAPEWGMMLPL